MRGKGFRRGRNAHKGHKPQLNKQRRREIPSTLPQSSVIPGSLCVSWLLLPYFIKRFPKGEGREKGRRGGRGKGGRGEGRE